MNLILKISLLALTGIAACNSTSDTSSTPVEESRIEMERVKLAELNGQAVDLSLFKGQTVFINFWATWCKPCLQEMPSIQRMMEKMNGKNIVFLFASDESPGQVEAFKNRYQYPFHYVRSENLEELNIMALPTTFIFDASGKLTFREMGFRQWDSPDNLKLLMKITKQK